MKQDVYQPDNILDTSNPPEGETNVSIATVDVEDMKCCGNCGKRDTFECNFSEQVYGGACCDNWKFDNRKANARFFRFNTATHSNSSSTT